MRMPLAGLLLIGAASELWAQSVPAAPSSATSWPDRPIRFIVPFPAGATTDVAARIVAQRLGDRLGQPVMIENRVGANGNLGAEAVAKSAADGYTIGLATATTHAIAPSLVSGLRYDPIRDFSFISLIATTPYALVVWPGVPVKSVAELVAYAKTRPGQLAYSSIGPSSLAHLGAQLFATTLGVEFTHVPYRSATQAVVDLVEGRIQLQFGLLNASLNAVREGKLRALAVTTARRSEDLPDVPTIAEAAIPDYEASLWMAIVMPSGVAAPIVERMRRELHAALEEPEIRKALTALALIIETSGTEEMQQRIVADIEKWRALAVKARIQPE
jgi:tripartite-type tricarboxylate transporter receptor subunit TctC